MEQVADRFNKEQEMAGSFCWYCFERSYTGSMYSAAHARRRQLLGPLTQEP